jgi:hypothetical protein
MKKAFDRQLAQLLLPLLRSIGHELSERLHEARLLQGRIALAENRSDDLEELSNLHATLSTHRREVRMMAKELERLGCTLDDSCPGRILIPGADGDVAHGYALDVSDPTLRRVSTGTAVG